MKKNKINLDLESSARRIKSIRMFLGMSRKKFESITGISMGTVRAWESGQNPLTLKGAERLEKTLQSYDINCKREWLLHGYGESPFIHSIQKNDLKTPMIPVKNPRNINNNIISNDFLKENETVLKEVEFFKQVNTNSITLMVSDDGMEPFYCIGDFIGGNKFNTNLDRFIGLNCIVQTKDGYVLCRRLGKNHLTNQYNLFCVNSMTKIMEPTIYNVDIQFVAEIIFHRKKSTIRG